MKNSNKINANILVCGSCIKSTMNFPFVFLSFLSICVENFHLLFLFWKMSQLKHDVAIVGSRSRAGREMESVLDIRFPNFLLYTQDYSLAAEFSLGKSTH